MAASCSEAATTTKTKEEESTKAHYIKNAAIIPLNTDYKSIYYTNFLFESHNFFLSQNKREKQMYSSQQRTKETDTRRNNWNIL